MTPTKPVYYSSVPPSATCFSEGVLMIFHCRLGTVHLWSDNFIGRAGYRKVLAEAKALIERRVAEDSRYAKLDYEKAQIRVVRHARYSGHDSTPKVWNGKQRMEAA